MTAATMTRAPARDRIDKRGLTVQIFFLMALLILFNVYPERVGAYRSLFDRASFTPLLGSGFWAALPWLNAWWVAALVLAAALLFFDSWTADLHKAGLALAIFGVCVGYRLLAGAPILIGPGSRWAVAGVWFPFSTWPLLGLNVLVRIGIGIWMLRQVIDAIRHLVRLLPGRMPSQSKAIGA